MKAMLRSGVAALELLAGGAWAAATGNLPEPGTFELLALGGVVALVIGIRNRRRNRK